MQCHGVTVNVNFAAGQGKVMECQGSSQSPARLCFDALATWYDGFTSADDYLRFGDLIGELARSGGVLEGSLALDVACGTGKSAYQLLRLGYQVEGCDISQEMLAQARAKPELAEIPFFWADACRRIETDRRYNLVTCLDDAVNFILRLDEFAKLLVEVNRVLLPGGTLIFDCNTELCYRTSYAETRVEENSDAYFVWRGRADVGFRPGDTAEADLFVLPRLAGSAWISSPHVQRHYPVPVVAELLQKAGMTLEATWGLKSGGILERQANESRHHKVIHVARRRRGL